MKFNKNKILIPVIAVVLFSGFIPSDNDIYFQINKSIDIYGRVYRELALNYVDPVNPEELMVAGLDGMLESLDPFTNYIDSNEKKDIDIITTGKYGGIGATIGLRNDDEVTIVDLIEGYSAQRQGLKIGDIIKDIDGEAINKDNYENLSEFLKGDPGTSIKMTISRDGSSEPIVFNLIREEIEVKNLTYYGFQPTGSNNAYLKLSGFTRAAGDEVKKALLELKSQKEIKSVVLDLRGNPGGLLDAAIDVCEKFLKKGQLIVSVKGRDSANVKEYYSNEEPILPDAKLTVLIDGGTASASEIVAGAIQDHDRGVILGTPSYGKGLVQTIIPLSYNTSLKITTAKYYTPSGRCIQKYDYSQNNRVFDIKTSLHSEIFHTDANRAVFSAGGIKPDTVISTSSSSRLVRMLLAEGWYFQFAVHYSNSNPDAKLSQISDKKLFADFNLYLNREGFKFSSGAEKVLAQLDTLIKSENYVLKDASAMSTLKNEFAQLKEDELNKNKDEVITYLKEELSAHENGRTGRIKETLLNDKQFLAAVAINANPGRYNGLLR